MKKFLPLNPSFLSIFIYFDSWEFYHFFCLTLSLELTRLWLRDERIIDVHWSVLSVQPQRGFRCLHYSDFLPDQRNWVYGSYQGPLWMSLNYPNYSFLSIMVFKDVSPVDLKYCTAMSDRLEICDIFCNCPLNLVLSWCFVIICDQSND